MSRNNNGRAQTQRIASGARAAPYARPGNGVQRTTSYNNAAAGAAPTASQAWPPSQISIRGASGPTWVVVSNLLRGTSVADIRETFQQFGEMEDVRQTQLKGLAVDVDGSLAFEVAFKLSTAADSAIATLDGALADGRVLRVSRRDPAPVKHTPAPVYTPAVVPTAPRRDMEMAAAATVTIPRGPAAQNNNNNNNNGKRARELLPATHQPQQGKQRQTTAAAQRIVAPPVNSLSSRILSAAELRTLSKKQERARLTKSAPNQAGAGSLALAKRIGSLPLAERLSAGGPLSAGKKSKGKAGSAAPLTATQAPKKNARRARKGASSAMQLD